MKKLRSKEVKDRDRNHGSINSNKGGKIQIIIEDGKVLFHGIITELPLREEYILERSITLFHEPEPCIIYRTHIAKRFYIELYDMLINEANHEIICGEMADLCSKIDINTVGSVIFMKR